LNQVSLQKNQCQGWLSAGCTTDQWDHTDWSMKLWWGVHRKAFFHG
jgi:hypothetical protein